MRILAGPLAGVLRMDRRRFTIFNFLGALCWVTMISLVGFFFGGQRRWLMHIVRRLDTAIVLAAMIAIGFAWLHWRKQRDGSNGQTSR